jgi:hypothetical protein
MAIPKLNADKLLAKVPEQFVFWVQDGAVLHDMKELGEALKAMSEETFSFHSNDYKNDFANWVKDIIGDEKLGRDLTKARSRVEAARVVSQRAAFLQNKLTKKA